MSSLPFIYQNSPSVTIEELISVQENEVKKRKMVTPSKVHAVPAVEPTSITPRQRPKPSGQKQPSSLFPPSGTLCIGFIIFTEM